MNVEDGDRGDSDGRENGAGVSNVNGVEGRDEKEEEGKEEMHRGKPRVKLVHAPQGAATPEDNEEDSSC